MQSVHTELQTVASRHFINSVILMQLFCFRNKKQLITVTTNNRGFTYDLLASLEKLPSIPFAEVTMSLDSSLPLLMYTKTTENLG